jgi:hypothetical protein
MGEFALLFGGFLALLCFQLLGEALLTGLAHVTGRRLLAIFSGGRVRPDTLRETTPGLDGAGIQKTRDG